MPSAAEEPYGVWQENWDAVRLFLSCGTQWRFAGMAGVVTGLDYAAVKVVADAMELSLAGDLLDRLRLLEGEAIQILAQRHR